MHSEKSWQSSVSRELRLAAYFAASGAVAGSVEPR
jgi:hypothetical protein